MLASVLEETMPIRSREISHGRCAYCSAPLTFNAAGVVAWRVGNRFVCNEFCADGIPDELVNPKAVPNATGPELPASFN
jgi:hypothetical protein